MWNLLHVFLFTFNYFANSQSIQLSESELPSPGLECGLIHNNVNITQDSPWSALIYYSGHRSGFFCGGSLINKNYVLSAAHCFQSRYSPKFVRLGEIDLGARKNCQMSTCAGDIPIAEIIKHENYDHQNNAHYNDIALIRLDQPIEFTDRIKPICLPMDQEIRNQNFDNIPLVAVGFGRTKHRQRSNIKTMQIVKGYNLDHCNEAYEENHIKIIRSQLCAAGDHGEDTCSGGGGGSLVGEHSINQTTYRYLAGIVSFGNRVCSLPNSPGIFTRVDQYLDWILLHMKN